MFGDMIRRLEGMERGVSIPIHLELDDAGFLDRKCPDGQCRAAFKVLFADWRDRVSDEAAFCPICRHQAPASEWNTEAQAGQIEAEALRYLQGEINSALSSAARSFNRSQPREGMIRVSMSYKPASLPVVVPAAASELLRQMFECEECSCHYSSLGAAFFCPACGHNGALSAFNISVDTVRKTIAALPWIRRAVAEATDADTAEDSARHICENSLVKLVSAFQRFAEALFDTIPDRAEFSPRRNLFQHLRESDELWRHAIDAGYADVLSADEFGDLEVFFQQRHLLAHRDGIVDQDYLDRSGDRHFALGQRLVIRPHAVTNLADLVGRLGDRMRNIVSG